MAILLISFLFQLTVMLLAGALICHFAGGECKAPAAWYLAVGFLCVFSVFELMTVPMVFARLPLHVLKVSYLAVLAAAVPASLIICRTDLAKTALNLHSWIRRTGWVVIPLGLCLLFQIWIVAVYVDFSVDAGYYVARASTDLYTDTLELYDPYTGGTLTSFTVRYVFACLPEYNAVMAGIFGIAPIIQAKVILSVLIILVVNAVYYLMGMAVFGNDTKKAALFVIFVFLVQFFSNTLYTSGTFLFTRTYEGKAILANAILPAVLWCHLLLWQDPERKDVRSILLFAGIASVMCSSSSMFLIPATLGAGGAAVLAAGKYWKLSYWYLLWLLPVVLEGVFYELLGHGILSSAI